MASLRKGPASRSVTSAQGMDRSDAGYSVEESPAYQVLARCCFLLAKAVMYL